MLQKKAIRIINRSKYDDHTNPLFKASSILKLEDLIYFHNALFMYDYYNNNLPNVFNTFFTKPSAIHGYNTRFASKLSFSIPHARTNYGKFNIRFTGAKVWNSVDDEIKNLSKASFKIRLKDVLLSSY